MALFINACQIRNERRKRQKAIKKKARIMTRTNKIMEMTDKISDLKARCSTSQTSLDSANRAFGTETSNFEGINVSKQIKSSKRNKARSTVIC